MTKCTARILQVAIVVLTIGVVSLLAQDQKPPAPPGFPHCPGGSAGQVVVNPRDGQPYVWIPPGTFQMGCSPGDAECQHKLVKTDVSLSDPPDEPSHAVEIKHGFWMGQTVVTVGAWKRHGWSLTAEKGHPWTPGWGDDRQPMVGLDWDEAQRFCRAEGMRLPTEEEWEYAARAGSTAARHGNVDEIAWYSDNSGNQRIDGVSLWNLAPVRKHYNPPGDQYRAQLKKNGNGPHAVGLKRPNAWNLYDMLGNVWQWTGDSEEFSIPFPLSQSGAMVEYAQRGGSWFEPSSFARVSVRSLMVGSSGRSYTYGAARCVGE